MKTTDIKLKREDIANLAAISSAGDEGYGIKSIGYTPYVNGFNKGANWQNEKDKVIIDKLIEALKELQKSTMYMISGGIQDGEKYNSLQNSYHYHEKRDNATELLNSLNIK